MTNEIRSSNLEKARVRRSPVSSSGFRHSFGFGHVSLGFADPCIGCRELHLIARRPRALWPDGNEMIPLVEMLADGRFKSAHDFLGQFVARFARTQSGAVVRNSRQHLDQWYHFVPIWP